MLSITDQSRLSPPLRTGKASTRAVLDWRSEAIAAYEWSRGRALAQLRDELAARIRRLTGRDIAPQTIWIDGDALLATLALDGVHFRLRRQSLTLVRPCVGCSATQLESAPIGDQADLGYALSEWQPRCRHCPIEDAPGWLYDTGN